MLNQNFNPNFKIKLDKPLKLGNMRKNRRALRKNANIMVNPLGKPISIVFCLPGSPFSNKFLLGSFLYNSFIIQQQNLRLKLIIKLN